MIFACKRCGHNFKTDDITQFYCEHCERIKKGYRPNEKLEADVREATVRGLTYGQYKGRKK